MIEVESSINETKFRVVTAPLQIDQMKEFINDKSIVYLIDCKNSQIKGQMLLTYISNLELPCNLILDELDKDEKFELLKAYFETKSICHPDVLSLVSAQILLKAVGADIADGALPPVLSSVEVDEFIHINPDLVNRWLTFVTSSMIYLLTSVEAIEEQYKLKTAYPEIDDVNYVGYNVVNLFSIPMFTEAFFSVPAKSDLFYFKRQFEDYIFKGNNFFFYYSRPENLIHQVFEGLLASDFDFKDLNSLEKN